MRRPMSNDERGDEDRAHDERVEQDAEGDDEADLGQQDERQHGERAERAGEHDARAEVITAPVTARPRSMPSRVPCCIASSRTRAIRKML